MAKGISINIGLNELDPNHYSNAYRPLFSCVRDAQNMADIAEGFEIVLLDKPSVTDVKTVKEKIIYASGKLVAGDILLITFSGHGSEIRDQNGNEPTGFDQTWCLYDRQLIDDELAQLWAMFKPEVRIFFISDSCHSGTVATFLPDEVDSVKKSSRVRTLQKWLSDKVISNYYKNTYEPIIIELQKNLDAKRIKSFNELITASFISISACQDKQQAKDGDDNGVFTAALKKVWNNKKFKGNYKEFYDAIYNETENTVNPTQNPKYYPINAHEFEKLRPFQI